MRPGALSLLVVVFFGCADTEGVFDDGGISCKDGESLCNGKVWETCQGGQWVKEDCGGKNQTCIEKLGCRLCDPGTKYCRGQDAFKCSADGNKETKLKTCRPDQQCALGECFDFCDLPQKDRSNVGCEFWAVDLPNEYYCMSLDQGKTCMTYGCAACQQFVVAIANTSGFEVTVEVEVNEAKPGAPPTLKSVAKKVIKAKSLEVIDLPMREVDCTEWYTDPTGKLRRKNNSESCLSSRAFRVKSSYPVVAYQFNPIKNDFSNGASLLIPINGLDKTYYVLGWSTSNPIAMPMPGQAIEGIPDFTNLTVVGTEDNTNVQVTLTHNTQASKDGKVAAAKKGDTIKATLNKFDVLNINSIQALGSMTGDLTGSKVVADKPVAVFSGGARASVPVSIDGYNPKPPEPSGEYDVCCTEHFEQQMFPISSLGKDFVVTRTPIRSTSSIIEPDFYRILATKDKTVVKTNLSDFKQFLLPNKGDVANFWSTKGFTVESNEPIMLAQYAVAQGFVDSYTTGGDPEFIVFPPVEQYRKEYIFLTPTTFTKDYVVIGVGPGTTVELDGKEVTGEFKTLCQEFAIGQLKGKQYTSLHCPVEDGVHTIKASSPVGIMVYGYYSVGSYGYPGGADVKQINIE